MAPGSILVYSCILDSSPRINPGSMKRFDDPESTIESRQRLEIRRDDTSQNGTQCQAVYCSVCRLQWFYFRLFRYSYTYHNQSRCYCPQRTSHLLYFIVSGRVMATMSLVIALAIRVSSVLMIRAPSFPRLLLLIADFVRVSIRMMI